MEKDIYKEKTIAIINDILIESRISFDLFSTNELERIIAFADYHKGICFSLIENYSKEEIMQKIEEKELNKYNQQNQANLINTIKNAETLKIIKSQSFKSIILSKNLYLNPPKVEDAWKFLSSGATLIDLKDIISSFDKMKLIKKFKKKMINNSNTSSSSHSSSNINDIVAMIQNLNKLFEEKEKKYMALYSNHYEENDRQYLKEYHGYGIPSTNLNIINKSYQKNFCETIHILTKLPLCLISFILSYTDIFTIGKLGLCSRALYNLVYRKVFLDEMSKVYNNAIWKNSSIYELSLKKLKTAYTGSFDMFLRKPRIRFGGIYYAKIKYSKECIVYGEEPKMMTVNYYRFLRFFPDGTCFAFVSPYHNTSKIIKGIQKGIIVLLHGCFNIDQNDQLIVKLDEKEFSYDMYIYKFIKGDYSFELEKYIYCKNQEQNNISIGTYFQFKFRSIEMLKDEFRIAIVIDESIK